MLTTQTALTIFERLLNNKFSITFSEDHVYEFSLIEIRKGEFIESLEIMPFSLLFQGKSDLPIFNQGHYKIESNTFEEVLFLVPRQPDKEGIYYEVMFN